jgi:hypothetical protein
MLLDVATITAHFGIKIPRKDIFSKNPTTHTCRNNARLHPKKILLLGILKKK